MSAVQASALTGDDVFARRYVHQAMVGYEGEKMSKSKGNLVLVSRLRADGVDPMAIRLSSSRITTARDWDYTPDLLEAAVARLDRWREALSVNHGAGRADLAAVRAALADDLDTRPRCRPSTAGRTGRCGRVGRRSGAGPGVPHGRRRARGAALRRARAPHDRTCSHLSG